MFFLILMLGLEIKLKPPVLVTVRGGLAAQVEAVVETKPNASFSQAAPKQINASGSDSADAACDLEGGQFLEKISGPPPPSVPKTNKRDTEDYPDPEFDEVYGSSKDVSGSRSSLSAPMSDADYGSQGIHVSILGARSPFSTKNRNSGRKSLKK